MSKIKKLIDNGIISVDNSTNNILDINIQQVNDTKYDFLPPKPILKWVGGKTQIINKLIGYFPTSINNYHEIFIGGGSVLFALLYLVKNNIITVNGTINAYDFNNHLISMYKIIQTKPKKLYKSIQKLINTYNGIAELNNCIANKKPSTDEEGTSSKESYYYWIRKQFNSKNNKKITDVDYAAMFIFLNKLCFRGLYRVGPNGFNVPYGNYKNPSIIDYDHLIEIHNLIQNVNFVHADFSQSMKNIVEGDFVYLDPPYAPENNKSFVSYTSDGFDLEQHEKLFNMCKELKNVMFMMSNADVELVRISFPNYNIESIECKRSINSKNPSAKTKEVIIKSGIK
jgi:DNA adenine methylase